MLSAPSNSLGIWTIGYGTTKYPDGKKVKQGDKVSIQQAKKFLQDKVDRVADEVKQLVKVPLTQNQFDAVVSFCYNVGIGAFKDSIVLKKLNQRDYQGTENEFLK
ncbi:MAG: lysozyme [Okeania sp. SIO2F4]|uniref:lysozyme n=1 Tax=Okeania sp. SIO2F4 TaxID=2607790 RepID=UPI00142AE33C|nr:lysozyme [Okeania sp. SIO2F4]NES05217.1 lysozyme [Okeania sp. SIO2F4]